MYDAQKFRLDGDVVLVTGAGAGIGRAIALTFAGAGASVMVSDLHLETAEAVAAEIRDAGGKAAARACNVTREEDLAAIVTDTVAAFDKLTLLVSNAGGGGPKPFDMPMADFRNAFDLNVFSLFHLAQLAAPEMEKAGGGSMLAITSMAGENKNERMASYGASKAATNHLIRNIAFDLGPKGIRVNGVAPGATRTAALESVLTPEIEHTMLAHTPIHRLGEAEDMANAALFLSSPAASWVSGQNYTDGILVLHKGRVVYERYDGCLDEHTLHGAMSVTKSITGLLAEVLIAEGKLDETVPIADIIPELKDSAFGDATVRQVLEMTTALDYSEDYSDPDAEVWTYAEAGSPLPKPEGYDGPRSYFDYLQTVEKKGTHGEAFGYKTVNSDAAGWLIARTTGVSVSDYLSNRIWSRIAPDREAFYTVDSIGTPFAGGGFNATLRDLARLGQLVLDGGRRNDEEIIPAAAIDRIRQGGDPSVFAKAGYDLLPEWSYRGMWWVSHDDHGAFAARGVHGQTIWIDPTADMVIVRFASHPVAGNAASDPTSLPAYRAVADYLMTQAASPQLVGPEWMIEDIAGRGVIDNSPASLLFLPEGRLAGNASCNRLVASYTVEDDALTVTQGGATMMLCPPVLMEQEGRLMAMLSKVTTYRIDDTDALILGSFAGEGEILP